MNPNIRLLLVISVLLGFIAKPLYDEATKQPTIDQKTVDKIEMVLIEEKLSEDQLHAFNSLNCQYLFADHLDGDEKRYAIANNLIHFADNMVASSMESHNGAATEVDLKEAEVFKNLAEKLIK